MLNAPQPMNGPFIATPPAGRDKRPGSGEDLANFSLRDTLSAISVREIRFGEFLAALKEAQGRCASVKGKLGS